MHQTGHLSNSSSSKNVRTMRLAIRDPTGRGIYGDQQQQQSPYKSSNSSVRRGTAVPSASMSGSSKVPEFALNASMAGMAASQSLAPQQQRSHDRAVADFWSDSDEDGGEGVSGAEDIPYSTTESYGNLGPSDAEESGRSGALKRKSVAERTSRNGSMAKRQSQASLESTINDLQLMETDPRLSSMFKKSPLLRSASKVFKNAELELAQSHSVKDQQHHYSSSSGGEIEFGEGRARDRRSTVAMSGRGLLSASTSVSVAENESFSPKRRSKRQSSNQGEEGRESVSPTRVEVGHHQVQHGEEEVSSQSPGMISVSPQSPAWIPPRASLDSVDASSPLAASPMSGSPRHHRIGSTMMAAPKVSSITPTLGVAPNLQLSRGRDSTSPQAFNNSVSPTTVLPPTEAIRRDRIQEASLELESSMAMPIPNVHGDSDPDSGNDSALSSFTDNRRGSDKSPRNQRHSGVMFTVPSGAVVQSASLAMDDVLSDRSRDSPRRSRGPTAVGFMEEPQGQMSNSVGEGLQRRASQRKNRNRSTVASELRRRSTMVPQQMRSSAAPANHQPQLQEIHRRRSTRLKSVASASVFSGSDAEPGSALQKIKEAEERHDMARVRRAVNYVDHMYTKVKRQTERERRRQEVLEEQRAAAAAADGGMTAEEGWLALVNVVNFFDAAFGKMARQIAARKRLQHLLIPLVARKVARKRRERYVRSLLGKNVSPSIRLVVPGVVELAKLSSTFAKWPPDHLALMQSKMVPFCLSEQQCLLYGGEKASQGYVHFIISGELREVNPPSRIRKGPREVTPPIMDASLRSISRELQQQQSPTSSPVQRPEPDPHASPLPILGGRNTIHDSPNHSQSLEMSMSMVTGDFAKISPKHRDQSSSKDRTGTTTDGWYELYGPQSCIGAVPVLLGETYRFSVRCVSEVFGFKIPADVFAEMVEGLPTKTHITEVYNAAKMAARRRITRWYKAPTPKELMDGHGFLRQCSKAAIGQIAAGFTPHVVRPGEHILRDVYTANRIVFIHSGKTKLVEELPLEEQVLQKMQEAEKRKEQEERAAAMALLGQQAIGVGRARRGSGTSITSQSPASPAGLPIRRRSSRRSSTSSSVGATTPKNNPLTPQGAALPMSVQVPPAIASDGGAAFLSGSEMDPVSLPGSPDNNAIMRGISLSFSQEPGSMMSGSFQAVHSGKYSRRKSSLTFKTDQSETTGDEPTSLVRRFVEVGEVIGVDACCMTSLPPVGKELSLVAETFAVIWAIPRSDFLGVWSRCNLNKVLANNASRQLYVPPPPPDVLRQATIFNLLSDRVLQRVAEALRVRVVIPDILIEREGHPLPEAFVVVAGSVHVCTQDKRPVDPFGERLGDETSAAAGSTVRVTERRVHKRRVVGELGVGSVYGFTEVIAMLSSPHTIVCPHSAVLMSGTREEILAAVGAGGNENLRLSVIEKAEVMSGAKHATESEKAKLQSALVAENREREDAKKTIEDAQRRAAARVLQQRALLAAEEKAIRPLRNETLLRMQRTKQRAMQAQQLHVEHRVFAALQQQLYGAKRTTYNIERSQFFAELPKGSEADDMRPRYFTEDGNHRTQLGPPRLPEEDAQLIGSDDAMGSLAFGTISSLGSGNCSSDASNTLNRSHGHSGGSVRSNTNSPSSSVLRHTESSQKKTRDAYVYEDFSLSDSANEEGTKKTMRLTRRKRREERQRVLRAARAAAASGEASLSPSLSEAEHHSVSEGELMTRSAGKSVTIQDDGDEIVAPTPPRSTVEGDGNAEDPAMAAIMTVLNTATSKRLQKQALSKEQRKERAKRKKLAASDRKKLQHPKSCFTLSQGGDLVWVRDKEEDGSTTPESPLRRPVGASGAIFMTAEHATTGPTTQNMKYDPAASMASASAAEAPYDTLYNVEAVLMQDKPMPAVVRPVTPPPPTTVVDVMAMELDAHERMRRADNVRRKKAGGKAHEESTDEKPKSPLVEVVAALPSDEAADTDKAIVGFVVANQDENAPEGDGGPEDAAPSHAKVFLTEADTAAESTGARLLDTDANPSPEESWRPSRSARKSVTQVSLKPSASAEAGGLSSGNPSPKGGSLASSVRRQSNAHSSPIESAMEKFGAAHSASAPGAALTMAMPKFKRSHSVSPASALDGSPTEVASPADDSLPPANKQQQQQASHEEVTPTAQEEVVVEVKKTSRVPPLPMNLAPRKPEATALTARAPGLRNAGSGTFNPVANSESAGSGAATARQSVKVADAPQPLTIRPSPLDQLMSMERVKPNRSKQLTGKFHVGSQAEDRRFLALGSRRLVEMPVDADGKKVLGPNDPIRNAEVEAETCVLLGDGRPEHKEGRKAEQQAQNPGSVLRSAYPSLNHDDAQDRRFWLSKGQLELTRHRMQLWSRKIDGALGDATDEARIRAAAVKDPTHYPTASKGAKTSPRVQQQEKSDLDNKLPMTMRATYRTKPFKQGAHRRTNHKDGDDGRIRRGVAQKNENSDVIAKQSYHAPEHGHHDHPGIEVEDEPHRQHKLEKKKSASALVHEAMASDRLEQKRLQAEEALSRRSSFAGSKLGGGGTVEGESEKQHRHEQRQHAALQRHQSMMRHLEERLVAEALDDQEKTAEEAKKQPQQQKKISPHPPPARPPASDPTSADGKTAFSKEVRRRREEWGVPI